VFSLRWFFSFFRACERVFAPLQDGLLVKGISYNLFIFSEEKNKE